MTGDRRAERDGGTSCPMKSGFVGLMLVILCCLPLPVRGESAPPVAPVGETDISVSSVGRIAKGELDWELDPYYSNISYSIPLTNAPIPQIAGKNEFAIYRELLKNVFNPRFVLLEVAAFPMPLAGVASKYYAPDFYRSFNVGSHDINLLEAVTAGFQEPYAISLFVGDLANFVKPGEERSSGHKGYMGYMVSYSNQHIKRNSLIPDNVVELEWKLKGDRVFAGDKLIWSFRTGAKIHDNPDISDTLYLGFRRSHLDINADFLSFLANSSVNFRLDFSARDGRPVRQEFTIGKKYPLPRWKTALKVDVGVIWEAPTYYSGALRDVNTQSLVAVIQPNFEF